MVASLLVEILGRLSALAPSTYCKSQMYEDSKSCASKWEKEGNMHTTHVKTGLISIESSSVESWQLSSLKNSFALTSFLSSHNHRSVSGAPDVPPGTVRSTRRDSSMAYGSFLPLVEYVRSTDLRANVMRHLVVSRKLGGVFRALYSSSLLSPSDREGWEKP